MGNFMSSSREHSLAILDSGIEFLKLVKKTIIIANNSFPSRELGILFEDINTYHKQAVNAHKENNSHELWRLIKTSLINIENSLPGCPLLSQLALKNILIQAENLGIKEATPISIKLNTAMRKKAVHPVSSFSVLKGETAGLPRYSRQPTPTTTTFKR